MDPQTNEQSGLKLPAPMSEKAPVMGNPNNAPAAAEMAPIGAEMQPSGATLPAAMPTTIPLPTPPTLPQTAAPAVATTTTTSDTPAIADDGDLIEKEWVVKAKKIVEATRDDPHLQSQQLTEVKVDYLQKRYNKSVKLSE
jgi:hypothetical protein